MAPASRVTTPGRFNQVGQYALNTGEGNCKVQQHKKKQCDINKIIAKYKKTGVLGDPSHKRKPIFADCTLYGDYHAMLNTVTNANRAFMSLPADLRKKFNHDPAQAYDFVSKPENLKEACDLGLLPESCRPKVVTDPLDPTKTVEQPGETKPAQNSDAQPQS